MTVVANWAGTGLTPGSAFSNGTAGTGDSPFEQVTAVAGTFIISDSGLYSPRIEMNQQSAQPAQFRWDDTAIGSGPFPQHAVRFYVEFTGYSSGNAQLFATKAADNTNLWWLDVTSAGILRLRNTGGSAMAVSSAALPLNQELRIEGVRDGVNATVYVYVGESLTPIHTLAGTAVSTTPPITQLQFGNNNATPTWPKMYWDNIAWSNTNELIGPLNPPEPSAFSLWNGSTETPLILEGVWDGSDIQPLSATVEVI